MNSHESFTAAIAVFVIFGLPIVWAISARWMAHQERMAMIARGMVPPPDPRMFRHGYVAPPTGGSFADPYAGWRAQRMLRGGVFLTMIGFALLAGLSFIRLGEPGPWLLGGLIPMFVGIAQIINALLSGARLSIPAGSAPGPAAPGPHPGEAQAPFTAARPEAPAGPYGWRPGNTPELHKPPAPPEPR